MPPLTKNAKLSRTSLAIRELRKLTGMTQKDFAKEMGVTLLTVARWETNTVPSGPPLMKLWAKARLFFNDNPTEDTLRVSDQIFATVAAESKVHRWFTAEAIKGDAETLDLFLALVSEDFNVPEPVRLIARANRVRAIEIKRHAEMFKNDADFEKSDYRLDPLRQPGIVGWEDFPLNEDDSEAEAAREWQINARKAKQQEVAG